MSVRLTRALGLVRGEELIVLLACSRITQPTPKEAHDGQISRLRGRRHGLPGQVHH